MSKKIKLILVFLICMFAYLFIVNNNVFATSETISFSKNGYTTTLSNVPFSLYDDDFHLLAFSTGSYIKFYYISTYDIENNLIYVDNNNGVSIIGQRSYFSYVSNNLLVGDENHSYDLSNISDSLQLTTSSSDFSLISYSFTSSIFTTFDIKDRNNHVVFQGARQGVTLTLAPIMEGQEMKPLEEITRLLPIILPILVGIIAIMKAIHWIIARMKQA